MNKGISQILLHKTRFMTEHQGPIRLAIIGLGKLWETRHRPALERMRDRFRIISIYDQVSERARRTALQVRCRHVESLTSAIDPDCVDAIYLLSPQWFDTYPIELAARYSLPVYTSVPVINAHKAREIQSLVHSGQIKIMPEFARRQYPATRRLLELIKHHIGPVRMILGQTRIAAFDRYGQPGPTTQTVPVALRVDPMYFLMDWVRYVIGDRPVGVIQSSHPKQNNDDLKSNIDTEFCSFTLRFEAGALAQLTCYRHKQSIWGDVGRVSPSPGYQVFAESGMAVLEMPDLIRWYDSSGYHEERLPMEPSLGEILNDQFFQMVRGNESHGPTVDDIVAVNDILGSNAYIQDI